MQTLFILVACGGALYFGFANRRFDGFCVAFGSALIYFLPGFVGEVPYASKGYWLDPVIPIESSTYGVMILVLSSIWVSALLYKQGISNLTQSNMTATMPSLAAAFTFLAVLGFVGTLLTTGIETLQLTEKELILERLNRSFTLWSTAASVGFVVAFALRRYIEMTICGVLLLGCLYVGFRVEFVVTMMSVFFLYAETDFRQRLLIRFRKGLIFAIPGIAFVLIYKIIYVGIKFDDYWFIYEQLSDPQTYSNVVLYSEPFYVQGTLNEVLANDFVVGMDHLVDVFFLFIPLATEVGITSVSFNDLFQPALFPQAISFGLANNIWAQMWSAGGWLLLFAFVVTYCAVIGAGESLRRKVGREMHAVIVVALIYWCFYIHRNDLIFQLLLERNIFLVTLIAYFVSRVINAVFVRRIELSPAEKLI